MPKVTLTFVLPEEAEEFHTTLQAQQWKNIIWDFKAYLRERLKYEELDEKTAAVLGTVSDKFWELIDESRLELN